MIRATSAIEIFENEPSYFGSGIWHKRFGVVTNIGVFLFLNETMKELKTKPEFFHWNHFKVEVRRAHESQDGKKNLFEFGNNDELKMYAIGS